MMKHLDLFSGIGGFALAVDSVWDRVEHIFCEIDPFCQTILSKHWLNSKIYGDIRTLNSKSLRNERIDILTGGFPCQPFSQAGKRKGTADDRYLWPEMRRVIQEFSPRWVVGENVRGLLSIEGGLVFEQVCTDLEAIGYEVQPFIIPACAVNAPHRRDRVWIVARHAKHDGQHGSKDYKSSNTRSNRDTERKNKDGKSSRSALSRNDSTYGSSGRPWSSKQKRNGTGKSKIPSGNFDWNQDWPSIATRLCVVDDGLSDGLARPRGWRNAALKAAGNAIVPQVAEQILKSIKQYDDSI